jgi:hypothetical protein
LVARLAVQPEAETRGLWKLGLLRAARLSLQAWQAVVQCWAVHLASQSPVAC